MPRYFLNLHNARSIRIDFGQFVRENSNIVFMHRTCTRHTSPPILAPYGQSNHKLLDESLIIGKVGSSKTHLRIDRYVQFAYISIKIGGHKTYHQPSDWL